MLYLHENREISMTSLAAIGPGDFTSAAQSLQVLHFSSNLHLSSVSQAAFSGMSSLHSLMIAVANLTTLHENTFDPLTNLTELVLHTNYLRTLPQCLFQRLAKLLTLDLSNNLIHVLGPGVFANLHHLTSLQLGNNQLTRLSPESFFLLPNTTIAKLSLDLIGNPFSCDCYSLWLHWLLTDAANREPHFLTPFCSAPSDLVGQPFDAVARTELCDDRTPRVLLQKNTVTRGQTTSMTCTSFVSSRRPIYYWYKNGAYVSSPSRKDKRYHVFYGVLTIENVTDDDAGIWRCHITDTQLGRFKESTTATLNVDDEPFCGHPVPGTQSDAAAIGQWVGVAVAAVALIIVCVVMAYCVHQRGKELGEVRGEVRQRSSSRQNLPRNIHLADDSFGLAENPEYLNYLKHTSRNTSQSSGVGAVSYQPINRPDMGSLPPASHVKTFSPSGASNASLGQAANFGANRGEFGAPRVVENPLVALGYTQSDFDAKEERESLATTTLNRSAAATDPGSEWSGIADPGSISYLPNNGDAMMEEEPGQRARDNNQVSLDVFNEISGSNEP
eukprot:scpid60457/ scgid1070/ Leucine-rich repeat and fibronectin type-III domain-containing protein 5